MTGSVGVGRVDADHIGLAERRIVEESAVDLIACDGVSRRHDKVGRRPIRELPIERDQVSDLDGGPADGSVMAYSGLLAKCPGRPTVLLIRAAKLIELGALPPDGVSNAWGIATSTLSPSWKRQN